MANQEQSATWSELLGMACGGPATEAGPGRRLQLAMAAALCALGLAALWGLAAGSARGGLALANLVKVPLVMLLSALSALPAALLTVRLTAQPYRGRELAFRHAASLLGAALVLAVLAPLVAIYSHTSTWAGPSLALCSVIGAIMVSALVLARGIRTMARERGWVALVPVVVLVTIQLVALLQFIALAAPFFPLPTAFDGGIDGLIPRAQ